MSFLTDMKPTPFLAVVQADIDWQKVGSNDNPYSAATYPAAHKAYDDRFEQIAFEMDFFHGRTV